MIQKIRKKFSRKLKDKDFSEIFSKSVTGFLISVVGRLLGFLEQIIISNLYGAAALGMFRLCFSYLNLVGIFGRFGIDTATARYVAQYRKQGDEQKVKEVFQKGFRIVTRLAIGLTILLILAAPLLVKYVYDDKYDPLQFQIIAFGILFFVMSGVIEEGLRGLKKIKQYTWINNVSTQALVICLLLLGLLLEDKTYVINTSYVIGLAFTFILGIMYWRKYVPKGKIENPSISTKELINTALPLLSAKYLTTLYTLLAIPILASFAYVTAADVGVFSGASRLAAFATMPLIAVNNITGPKFTEAFAIDDIQLLKKNVKISTRLIFWSCIPIMLVFFLIPKFILNFWGEEFITPKAVLAFHIINIGQIVNFATGPVTQLLNMTGRQRITQRYAAISTVSSLALSFLFIAPWGLGLGIIGAALSIAVGRTILNLGCSMHIYFTMKINTIYNPFADLYSILKGKKKNKKSKDGEDYE
ncbi:MAG: oligosaccharide flippase family protein [Chitinophagales bacterium]